MSTKFFGFIVTSALLIQISFSFYYSSEIINQNNELNTSEIKLKELEKQQIELEKKLSEVTSLSNLENQILNKNLVPIKTEINLIN